MAKLDWNRCRKTEYVSKVYKPNPDQDKVMRDVYNKMSNYYWHLPPYAGKLTKELPLEYLAQLGATLPLDSEDLTIVKKELARRIIKQRRSK